MENRTKEEITKEILEYFENNQELFNDCIEELDSYCGYLGDDRYFPMEELDELFYGQGNIFVLQRAFYGYDSETWTTDSHGEKEYGAFNPNRDYFTFNGYGNLVSADYKDYSSYLDSYAIGKMLECRKDIYALTKDEELTGLFEELENAEGDD